MTGILPWLDSDISLLSWIYFHFFTPASSGSFWFLFIQLHFGVNSGATRFAIEKQAVNEANFRCPDEMGWKPQVRLEYWIDFKFALINKPLELMSSELLHRNLHNFMLQKVPIVPSDGGISRTREVKWITYISHTLDS